MVIVDFLLLVISDVNGIIFLVFIDDYFVSDMFILLEIFGNWGVECYVMKLLIIYEVVGLDIGGVNYGSVILYWNWNNWLFEGGNFGIGMFFKYEVCYLFLFIFVKNSFSNCVLGVSGFIFRDCVI